MAQSNGDMTASGYRPEMDGKAHEQTFRGFEHFTVVGTVAVIAIVVALAVGGVKHAWISTLVMLAATLVATAIGLGSARISWRAPAVPLVLLFLMLLFY